MFLWPECTNKSINECAPTYGTHKPTYSRRCQCAKSKTNPTQIFRNRTTLSCAYNTKSKPNREIMTCTVRKTTRLQNTIKTNKTIHICAMRKCGDCNNYVRTIAKEEPVCVATDQHICICTTHLRMHCRAERPYVTSWGTYHVVVERAASSWPAFCSNMHFVSPGVYCFSVCARLERPIIAYVIIICNALCFVSLAIFCGRRYLVGGR